MLLYYNSTLQYISLLVDHIVVYYILVNITSHYYYYYYLYIAFSRLLYYYYRYYILHCIIILLLYLLSGRPAPRVFRRRDRRWAARAAAGALLGSSRMWCPFLKLSNPPDSRPDPERLRYVRSQPESAARRRWVFLARRLISYRSDFGILTQRFLV